MKIMKIFFCLLSLVFCVSGCSADEDREDLIKTEKPYQQDIAVHEHRLTVEGLEEEFNLFFMADTHISLCDDRDSDIMEKAVSRYEMFRSKEGIGSEESFRDMIGYVTESNPDLLILGGDILDSAMWKSIDYVTESLQKLEFPWIYEMGNHDFEYGLEYFSPKCYSEYLPRLHEITDTYEGWQKIEYDEFIVFAVDDHNNQISEEALLAFQEIYDLGKAVILISHVPLEPQTADDLWQKSNEVWGASANGNSRVLLGEHSCVPNEVTAEFIELVTAAESPVLLVLSGHVHFYHEGKLTDKIQQIVTGAGFNRELVKITLVPEIME